MLVNTAHEFRKSFRKPTTTNKPEYSGENAFQLALKSGALNVNGDYTSAELLG
jgi:hypothetical protein